MRNEDECRKNYSSLYHTDNRFYKNCQCHCHRLCFLIKFCPRIFTFQFMSKGQKLLLVKWNFKLNALVRSEFFTSWKLVFLITNVCPESLISADVLILFDILSGALSNNCLWGSYLMGNTKKVVKKVWYWIEPFTFAMHLFQHNIRN